jgi:cytochrome P450 family 142 subfamily A polypeptide 1
MMIGKLLGFDPDAWPQLQSWSERTIALGGGPRYHVEDGIVAAMDFAQASADLHAEKLRCPAKDVMTIWTQAEIDGCPVGVDNTIADSLLLLDGGAETTRTVIARSLINFTRFPDQWALLKDGTDLEVATEELIRFVTPIHNMCRVATEDVELGGSKVRAGDQLVLMYSSANRDPAHFDDPEALDLTRYPNRHLAFGFGTHFCLGASLARLEIRLFLEELVRRVGSLRLVPDSVVEMPNAFVYGLRAARMELDFVDG